MQQEGRVLKRNARRVDRVIQEERAAAAEARMRVVNAVFHGDHAAARAEADTAAQHLRAAARLRGVHATVRKMCGDTVIVAAQVDMASSLVAIKGATQAMKEKAGDVDKLVEELESDLADIDTLVREGGAALDEAAVATMDDTGRDFDTDATAAAILDAAEDALLDAAPAVADLPLERGLQEQEEIVG